MNLPPVFQTVFLGNTLQQYLIASVFLIIAVPLLKILSNIFFSRMKKLAERTVIKHDDFAIEVAEKTLCPLLAPLALYFAVNQLTLNPGFYKLINVIGVVILTIQVTKFAAAVLSYILEHTWLKRQATNGGSPVSKSILSVLHIVIWTIGIVFLCDNLGFNVSAIVAGLGVTGVAVALAAQTILGDLFNYFVIFFDRPFEEGDFIIIEGGYMGVIENIGIKSTRIRSLDGEQIVVSNSNLTGSRIRNYKRMAQRRVLFKFGVIYETPTEKLEKIPGIIKSIIESHQKTRFDRAHFQKFGDYSLDYEVVYFALTADYNIYMDIQQNINLAVKAAFEKEKIEFAYPTQLELYKNIPG